MPPRAHKPYILTQFFPKDLIFEGVGESGPPRNSRRGIRVDLVKKYKQGRGLLANPAATFSYHCQSRSASPFTGPYWRAIIAFFSAPSSWRREYGNTPGGSYSPRSHLAVSRFVGSKLCPNVDFEHAPLGVWAAPRHPVCVVDRCPPFAGTACQRPTATRSTESIRVVL
jgi:hypothetical protein